jgi:hypothetical protein
MASLSPLAQQLIREAQREALPTSEQLERAHARFVRATGAWTGNTELALKKQLLTLLAVGSLLVGTPSSAPPPQQTEAIRAVPSLSSVPRDVPQPALSSSASPESAPPRPATPPRPRTPQPSTDADSLRKELAALNTARRAAGAARYAEASQALASVKFRQLALERDALQLWLRCQQGDTSAVTAARSFLARHPSHPMFSKVQKACLEVKR